MPALLAEEPLFSAALESLRAEGRSAVPYLETDAIREVAQDEALVSAIEEILGTRELVMWGANIRQGTPNAAGEWHVDLESLIWPTVTVGIGLGGCTPASATWFLPGTHRLRQAPPPEVTNFPAGSQPRQITGFRDGSFYAFDARGWHRGDPAHSQGRVMLFLHYQRASEARIPMMEDYRAQRFSKKAAPFFPLGSRNRLCTGVASIPWWYRWQRLRCRLGVW